MRAKGFSQGPLHVSEISQPVQLTQRRRSLIPVSRMGSKIAGGAVVLIGKSPSILSYEAPVFANTDGMDGTVRMIPQLQRSNTAAIDEESRSALKRNPNFFEITRIAKLSLSISCETRLSFSSRATLITRRSSSRPKPRF